MNETAPVALTLDGDPTLEQCDQAVWDMMQLLLHVGDALTLEEFKVGVRSMTVTCGICEAVPITWVAVEREGRIVRVARCPTHRPESDFTDLAPVREE